MIRLAGLTIIAVILLTGCDRNNYLGEKAYWKAEQVLKRVDISQLEAKGTDLLKPSINAFENVVEKYPSSSKAVDSLFIVSKLYLKTKNYDKAIEELQRVVQNYSHLKDKTSEARYRIAEIYEYMGDWKTAEKAFWELSEFHPLHPKGLFAPVHVIVHYKKANDPVGQQKAYARAMDFYNSLSKRLGPIQGVASVINNKAMANLANGSWRKAEEDWISIPSKFPESPLAPLALLAAAELSWSKANYGSAEEYYAQYFDTYPGHPLRGRTAQQLAIQYLKKGDYSLARDWFSNAIEYSGKNREGIAESKLGIAKAYELEGKLELSREVYEEVWNEYDDTLAYLQTPLLLAKIYKKLDQEEAATKILKDALDKYINLEKTSRNVKMVAYAQQLKTACLTQLGEWKQIMNTFQNYMVNEPSKEKKGKWLFAQAILAEQELKDGAQAASLYDELISDYPEHPLAETARSRRELLTEVEAS
ncbi:tetratricopeptide repeat protein [Omnitrophica bacterium]|nr:tetratricopeptide repeat protein [Candidatus Omnitrophota bacterium]